MRFSIAAALGSGNPILIARAATLQTVLDDITALATNKMAVDGSVDPLDYQSMLDSMTNADSLDNSLWPVADYDIHRRVMADEIMKLSDSDTDVCMIMTNFMCLSLMSTIKILTAMV